MGAKTALIEPGCPWENGYCEIFHSKLRGALLNGEIFYSFAEARVVIEAWPIHYNHISGGRQRRLRVRNQNHGTTSARYRAPRGGP